MADEKWQAMSLARLRAARALLELGFYGDSVSRSYYAAYCAATSVVMEQMASFAHGFRNPSHEQLPQLVLNARKIPVEDRRKAKKLLLALRQSREDADYRPRIFVGRALALDRLQDAARLLPLMEVYEDEA